MTHGNRLYQRSTRPAIQSSDSGCASALLSVATARAPVKSKFAKEFKGLSLFDYGQQRRLESTILRGSESAATAEAIMLIQAQATRASSAACTCPAFIRYLVSSFHTVPLHMYVVHPLWLEVRETS